MKIQILIVCLLFAIVMGCKKDESSDNPGTSTLMLRMTDAPANYDGIFIDLQNVEITGSGGNGVILNVNSGIYNLLDFANGLDTLIATATLQAGTVQQIRLILGSNNSIMVDSVMLPLSTPSAEQSGLKLQVHETLAAGVVYTMLLDFDATQSIVQEGNGQYKLKPVIRVVNVAVSGSIKGKVFPPSAHCTVTATSQSSYSSVTNANGDFLVQGVPAGVYTVTVTPDPPLVPVTINNVSVNTGSVTDMGVVYL